MAVSAKDKERARNFSAFRDPGYVKETDISNAKQNFRNKGYFQEVFSSLSLLSLNLLIKLSHTKLFSKFLNSNLRTFYSFSDFGFGQDLITLI